MHAGAGGVIAEFVPAVQTVDADQGSRTPLYSGRSARSQEAGHVCDLEAGQFHGDEVIWIQDHYLWSYGCGAHWDCSGISFADEG